MHVVVTRELPGDALRRLDGVARVRRWSGAGPPPPGELLAALGDAEGLLCMLTDHIDAPLMDAAPRLRVISQMAVGVDNVDLEAATARGLPVGHTPGVLTDTTADLAFALIAAVMRRLPEAERYLRDGRWTTWSPDLLLGRDLHGATLGIVGMGAIGQAVARRARGFDMAVLYTSRTDKGVEGARRVDLDDLLKASDVVSVHVALTPSTRGMIGPRELTLMRPDAYLVNTARGGIVDEAALVEALRYGGIAGAGLDVYETEPLPPGSPLLELPNVVLLPHVGSASVATRERMASLAVDNLLAGLRDERLPHCANPSVYPTG